MTDKRKLTAPINGRKGGAPKRPHAATRLRAAIAQQHAELSAEATIEQIARGALFDPRDFVDAQGLPTCHAFCDVVRHQFAHDTVREPVVVYFH